MSLKLLILLISLGLGYSQTPGECMKAALMHKIMCQLFLDNIYVEAIQLPAIFTPWCFSVTKFTVCNETGQLSELQANICAVKKDVDALRNVTNLLLNYYMLPHDIQSMTTVQ